MKKLPLLLILGFCYLTGTSQAIRLQENFNAASLPAGWTNTAVSGTQTWNFGINGSATNAGNNNLNRTAMAFFDDDNLGASNTNNTVSLTSPVFDNSTDSTSTLEFDYNFREFAGPADRFYVEVYDGTAWNTIFSTRANDCGNWLGACVGNFPHANIDITAHKNANCQVRFTYHDGNDWCWYVGIDNVLVTSSVNDDLEVTSIENPKSSCSLGSAEAAQVLLKNLGSNNITSPFTVTIVVDNGNQTITDTVNSAINVGDSLLYTFNSTLNLSNKAVYALKAYSSFSLDSIYGNDTAAASVENITALNIPFIQDFESSTSNWIISGQNSSWQIGTPNGIILDSAYRGTGAAVTNLTGNYNSLETSYLETACISSTQTSSTPILSFYINHTSEPYFDELILESSIDDGTSWQKVNAGSSSSNWYANNSSWNGSSNGWVKVENYLDSLANQSNFKLRFTFTSDGSANLEGFAIDNFSVRYPQPFDISLNSINYPNTSGPSLCGYATEGIIVEIQNKGANPIDTVFMFYQIDNLAPVGDTFIGPLATNSLTNFVFSQKANFSVQRNYNLSVWGVATNDGYNQNDSLLSRTIVGGPSTSSLTLPVFENFDGVGWSNGLIPSPWVRSPLPNVSNFTWFPWDTVTGSLQTGPDVAHSQPNFLYTESSQNPGNFDAILETPCINLGSTSVAIMEFWYHKYGNTMGDLFVEVIDGSSWTQLLRINGQTNTGPASISPWLKATVNLNNYAGQRIKLRWRATWVSCCAGDMAIDDVYIYDPLTVGIREIVTEPILKLYPNPNNGNFNLNVSNELVGKYYHVFDVKGGLLKQARIDAPNSQIELSNAEKGIYFIRVEGYAKAERIVVL